MSDRTVIRPGGRQPPRKGGDDASSSGPKTPATGDGADDRTRVNTRQSEPPPEVEGSDKTQVRPKQRADQAPEQPPAPVDLSEIDKAFSMLDDAAFGAPATQEGDDEETRFRSAGPTPARGRATAPESAHEDETRLRSDAPDAIASDVPAPDEETRFRTDTPDPAADVPIDGGADEETRFRSEGNSAGPDRSIQAPVDDGQATQFRPQTKIRPGKSAGTPIHEQKTQLRPSAAAPRQAPAPAGDQVDRTRLRTPESRQKAVASAALEEPTSTQRSLSTSNQFVRRLDALAGDAGVIGLVSPLLIIVGRLQSVGAHPNLEEFKQYAVESIQSFESISFGFGGPEGARRSKYCSYGLCCLTDEIVLSTPWGTNSSWKQEGLLQIFHGKADGDDRFFEILEELRQEPVPNLPVLELFYLCLELGFEGKYRDMQGGNREIHELRNQLFKEIGTSRGPRDQTLSESWQGVEERRPPLMEYVPFWVVLAVTLGILLAVYAGFNIVLSQETDEPLRTLAQIGADEVVLEARVFEAPPVLTSDGPLAVEPDLARNAMDIEALRSLLFLEIDEGVIEIVDRDDALVLRIKHPNLFKSGSDQFEEGYSALIETIGGFIRDSQHRILVTGHTDDVPVRSLKYPSNWELSKARAESVRDVLAASAGPGLRILTQGLADTDNIVPNDSATNRAINRRVEIQIKR